MKSLILTAMLAVTGLGLFAQKVDKAKDLLSKGKLTEAKTEIDNYLAASDKNKSNSEAWYTKSKVYTAISKDSTMRTSEPDARNIAFDAMKTYAQLEDGKDSAKRFALLTLDNRQPLVDLYGGYSKDAASYYNAGNFNDAFTNFKNSLDVFEFLSSRGWTNNIKLDTVTTLYTGISAEKANKLDTAAIYYGKIADNKAKGEGYVEIYKWLTDHYSRKGDKEKSAHYLALGKEVYPNDPFWSGFELDALSSTNTQNKDSLFSKYEEVIKNNPDNHLYHFNYAVELYQTAYNADSTKRPANSKELIDRAKTQLNDALRLKADYPNANLVMGQILYNEGVDISNYNKGIRPPTGGKLKPEQLKQKEQLRTDMNKKYDEALVYLDKVDKQLGSQGKLKGEDKQFLKDTYDLIISIYEQRQNNDKVTEYTEKFNNVEKNH